MKRSVRYLFHLAVAFCLACNFACISPQPPMEETKPPPSQPVEVPVKPTKPEPPAEEPTQFPLTITDDLGRKIQIDRPPQRIVSLAPSNTEIIYALGLQDKLVGTTDYCDYPEAAKSKPRVASYTTPNLEKVVSVQPDLILAEAIHEKTALPALEKLGLKVIVMSATSLDSVLNDIKLVGQITARNQAATKLVDDLTKRIEAVEVKTSALPPEQRLKVLYVVWHDPIWTMGRETFISDLIWRAGGTNIFAADFEKSRVVSLEAIIQKNPQVILVSGMGTTGDLIYTNVKKETRLSEVDAMRNNRVYKISDANLIERPGPRIVDGLEEVAKLLHPEIFGAVK